MKLQYSWRSTVCKIFRTVCLVYKNRAKWDGMSVGTSCHTTKRETTKTWPTTQKPGTVLSLVGVEERLVAIARHFAKKRWELQAVTALACFGNSIKKKKKLHVRPSHYTSLHPCFVYFKLLDKREREAKRVRGRDQRQEKVTVRGADGSRSAPSVKRTSFVLWQPEHSGDERQGHTA